MKILTVLLLLYLSICQTYLPKAGEIPWNDLLSYNTARAVDNDFWKV